MGFELNVVQAIMAAIDVVDAVLYFLYSTHDFSLHQLKIVKKNITLVILVTKYSKENAYKMTLICLKLSYI